ncbi:hypothetical protein H0O02_01250 [Candidatus Micrarchaeota archaeon]|nr:hypothetical protein [Candidatus Micrarchaeota archaeon]
MHENPSHSVIMKTVDEIRSAEEKYDKTLTSAKEKADAILRKAKEDIAEEKAAVQEEITKHKNDMLKSGKNDIEKDVGKTLEKAKEEAERLGKKKVSQRAVLSIGKLFISQL